ncbi:MAG: threonine/serine exporter family protein [Rubripirellula sp.]
MTQFFNLWSSRRALRASVSKGDGAYRPSAQSTGFVQLLCPRKLPHTISNANGPFVVNDFSETNAAETQLVHDFLIKVGLLLHRFGTPSHRLERVMTQVSKSLGVSGVFLYTPTALVISIADAQGEKTYLRRVDSGSINVDKLIRFDEVLEQLEDRRLSVAQASKLLDKVEQAAPPYSEAMTVLACAISCGAVAIFFRGSFIEVAVAMVLGLVVALLEVLHARLKLETGFLEPLAGIVASVGALAIAHFVVPIDDRLVTLAALIVMIPGLRLTVALTELAVGHLSAGVARLAGASVSLLTITIGVALGWQVANSWRNLPLDTTVWAMPAYWQWIAISIAPITFSIVFRARWPQWPVIFAVTVVGFVVSMLAGAQAGREVGAFCGALSVGIGSNLYARIRDRPALVPLTPGIIVLVPGSLGYRSLTAFIDHDSTAAVEFGFSMVMVAVALVGGILTSNAVLPPKRIL